MPKLWDQIGVPHKGWRCIYLVDLCFEQGDDYEPEVCQMCGQENLRYVHTMQHPDYPHALKVGCVCAEKMEDDYIGPRQRESKLANRVSRRRRWRTRNWRESGKGNHFLNVEGCNVVIYPDKLNATRWRFRVRDEFDETTFSDRSSATQDEAKLAAFDWLAEYLDW